MIKWEVQVESFIKLGTSLLENRKEEADTKKKKGTIFMVSCLQHEIC